MADDKRSKILEKVGALLAKAEGSSFGPERDAFRAKADELMLRYAIEHSEIIQREGKSLKDQVVKKTVEVGDDDAWLTEQLDYMLRRVAEHCRCEHIGHPPYRSPYDAEGTRYTRKMSVIGMESDVDYAIMLFQSLRLQMAADLEPTVDPSKSMIENLAALKEAGLKWDRVHTLLHAAGMDDREWKRSVGVSYTKKYTEHCEAVGKERRNVNPITIQRSFTRGFVTEVTMRFRELKRAQKAETDSNSAALVPVTSAVKEAFNEMFPSVSYGKTRADNGQVDGGSYSRGKAAGRRADLAQPRVGQRGALEG